MSDFTESSGGSVYAQIVVPSYTLAGSTSTSASAVTTGSSFLRLGAVPTSNSETSGYTNSIALANLVGNATNIGTAETGDDSSPEALISPDDWEGEYKGDPNFLLGFADDTRYHGNDANSANTYIDWVSVSNTTTVRKAETKRLLTKGGWWDHSDGNRITTTSGDKVEVIQGNYKLVVLGRQSPSTSTDVLGNTASVSEFSGAITDPNGPTSQTIEYVQSDGVWTCYQETSGNVVSKFHGKQSEYWTGKRKESYTGKDPSGAWLTQFPDDDCDPVIIDKTWAKRIETYLGSDGKPVQLIYNHVHCEGIENLTFATEILNYVMAVGIFNINAAVGTLNLNMGIVGEINLGAKWVYSLREDRTAVFGNAITAEKLKAAVSEVEATISKIKVGAKKTKVHGATTDINVKFQKLQEEELSLSVNELEMTGNNVKMTTGNKISITGGTDQRL